MQTVIGRLNQLLSHTDYHQTYRAFVRGIYANIGSKVGWEVRNGESHQETLLRTLVLGQLGYYGEPSVVEESRKRLQAHISGTAVLPADLRAPVYKTVVMSGDEKTYNQMIKLYRETDHKEEKDRIIRCVGVTHDPKLIQQVLQFAMSDEVRNQDTVFAIAAVTMSAPGRNAAWAFFRKHHEEFVKRYEGGYLLITLVKYLTCHFVSEEMAEEIQTFFKEHSFPSTERTIQQSLETIRLNSSWLARDSAEIKNFLVEETS